ncbi:MAG: hypothetical protein WDO18_20975 [Acidobacteriota bacterium]
MDEKLKAKVQALQLNTAGLLKLLGEKDKLRFWEILKGITTPAEFRLVTSQLDAINASVAGLQKNMKGLEAAAGKIR